MQYCNMQWQEVFVVPVEQRRPQRVECLKAGQVVLTNGSGIMCMIRNMSPSGACLRVASHFGVSRDIFLWVEGESSERPCRIVWQNNSQLGVHFSKAAAVVI